ncbi:MAG TPA: VanZ family protein [Anaerolineales bacterium]
MRARAIAFGLLFIVLVLAADAGLLGFVRRLHQVPLADKLGHFVLYGMLNLLITLPVFQDHRNWDKRRVVAVRAGLMTLVAGLEEWTQLYISSRTFSTLGSGGTNHRNHDGSTLRVDECRSLEHTTTV